MLKISVEKLPHDGTHSTCLQKVFSEETKRQAEKLLLCTDKGRESQKERKLKQQGDGDA